MRILVCVKHVPDTTEVRFDPATQELKVRQAPTKINNYDEHALEAAVVLRETQQAEVVVGWLVQKGVAAGRLSAVGAGESVPLFSNRTEDGRSKNRRVEIKVLDATVPPAPPGGAASPTGPQVVRPSPSGPAPTVPAPAPVVVPP